jgi:hypothetical protein
MAETMAVAMVVVTVVGMVVAITVAEDEGVVTIYLKWRDEDEKISCPNINHS